MAAPVLIAAPRHLWNSLVAGSGLPRSFFAEAGVEDESVPERGCALFCGESLFAAESLEIAQLEQLDRLLFACREGSFVWLHQATGDAASEFEKLLKASRAWSDLVGQRQRRFESVIRPVAVLVGGESSAGKEMDFRDFLRRFNDAKDKVDFRDVFVMAPRLEPSGREIFHARNVWPLSVSRLLLYLSARTLRNDASAIYAWKFREFRHTEPGVLYERLVPACSDALFNKLKATGQTVAAPSWAPSEGCLALEEEIARTSAYWHVFPAVSEAEQSTAPQRILQRLSDAGSADAAKRAGSVLERWQTRDNLIEKFWTALHKEAGAAWSTETALRAADRPDLSKLGNTADAHLESLPDKIQALAYAGESLKTGAAELAKAQSWFVQRWFRLAIALSAASLLGVIFFRAAQLKFVDPWMAGVVASGCFIGALFAAALFYALETWRGEKGVEEWGDRKKRFEAALADLNANLCSLKTAASRLAADSANMMLQSKLLRLLSRLTSAVASVFKPSSAAGGASGDQGAERSKSAIRYLEKSTVRLGAGTEFENETDRDLANHAVSLLLNKTDFFNRLSEKWVTVCQRTDAPPKGAVDAAALHGSVADVMVGLPSEVDRIVSEAARKSSPWGDLNASMRKIDDHGHNFELLSVELSDTAQLAPFRELLVSRSYAEENDEMRNAGALPMPEAAEAACPVLLVEFSKISTGGDLTPIKPKEEVVAQ